MVTTTHRNNDETVGENRESVQGPYTVVPTSPRGDGGRARTCRLTVRDRGASSEDRARDDARDDVEDERDESVAVGTGVFLLGTYSAYAARNRNAARTAART